jgi:hypothetical protein
MRGSRGLLLRIEGKGTGMRTRLQTNIHDNIYDLETRCGLLSVYSSFSRTKQSMLPQNMQSLTYHHHHQLGCPWL